MKNIKLSVIVILAIAILSCESKGPRGQVYVPDVSIDEVVDDVLDGNDWIYYYDIELHYKQDGEWASAGMYRMYSNKSDDDDGCSYWIDFSGFMCPVKKCSNYGYSYKLQYQGIWFYF